MSGVGSFSSLTGIYPAYWKPSRPRPVAATLTPAFRNSREGRKNHQCSEAACVGLGGKAGLVSVPRISASAVCSALSSFASFGT